MKLCVLFPAAVLIACCIAACGDNQTHPPPDRPPYQQDSGTLTCVPNLDGQIDASELQAALGIPVSYLVSPQGATRAVDLVGSVVGGQRRWDLSIDFADDAQVFFTADAPTSKWWASSFPTAQFTAPFDAGHTLDGVYRHDQDALWLLGVASADANPPEGKTLLVYDTPIPIIRFPLTVGASWVATGSITNGFVRGLPYAGKDVYEVDDAATGSLVLHDLTFQQVHELHTHVTVSPAVGASTSERQVSFFGECFGEVARATSQPGESDPNFGTAAELRRLGLTADGGL